jgi:hypothetical protein
MTRAPALALLLALAVSTGGCAYTWTSRLDGTGQSRTVRVTTAENQLFTPRPGLEFDLVRRLKDEIAQDRRLRETDLEPDIELALSLVEFREPTLIKDVDTALPAEVRVTATVKLEARGPGVPGGPAGHGGVLRRTLSQSAIYAPAIGESRADALNRLWRDLSRDIIDAVADIEWAPRG